MDGAIDREARRLRILRLLAFVIVPALFIGLLALGLTRKARTQDLVGTSAPEFDLPLVSGGTFSSQDLKGQPVVVNFWASWCLPCREEAPLLEEKWKTYRDRGIRFLGVNVKDSLEDARAFTTEFGLTFPSVRDTDLNLYSSFGLRGLPETFFIDHTWRFRGIGGSDQTGRQRGFKILGAISPAVLDSQIRLLLKLKEEG